MDKQQGIETPTISPLNETETLSGFSRFMVWLWKVRVIALGISGAVIVALLIFAFKPSSQTFGVVDVQRIIAEQAKNLASQYPQGQVPKEKLRETVEEIKETLDAWAHSRKIVLIAKGALWGGQVPDYTEHLGAMLNKGKAS